MLSVSRRQVIRGLAAGVVCMAGGARAALVPTPDEGPGPFYPETIPLDHDADLVQVAGRAGMAQGEIVNLFGRVLTLSGEPVPGALVEIWQCDYRGRYKHAAEWRGAADPNFQGYGTTKSTGSGSYRFRTIKPVRYTGRTPHIHAMISGPGIKRFTTQIYLKGIRRMPKIICSRGSATRRNRMRRRCCSGRVPATAPPTGDSIS